MGMQNTLLDLNNHLFAELERLGDEGLKGDRLKEECNRAKAISAVAGRIVSNAAVILNAKKLDLEYGENEAPRIFLGDKTDKRLLEEES